ncbi:MAG: dihydropteroate synthase [Planctomycetes bacterium]|nr:dihydropteroate synthase [Planctomycetota bacterium]
MDFIIVGERINGMFKNVKKAIKEKDPSVIEELAKKQTQAGAKYLDINVGTAAEDPADAMKWLIQTVQNCIDTPIAIDTQKAPILEAALSVVDGRPILLNSARGGVDSEIETFVKLAVEHNGSIVALTMDASGPATSIEARVGIGGQIIEKAMGGGLDLSKVFIDPVVLPAKYGQEQPRYVLESIKQILEFVGGPDSGLHFIVGLSNLSQMAKEKEIRELINRTFVVMAIAAGLDAAILDANDDAMVDAIITAEMVLNKQIYTDSFLKAGRM